jgi:hypothetical protein
VHCAYNYPIAATRWSPHTRIGAWDFVVDHAAELQNVPELDSDIVVR